MYAIRSYYVSLYTKARNDGARFDFISVDKLKELVKSREFKVAAIIIALLGGYIFILMLPGNRITSYNVCYTKLLRLNKIMLVTKSALLNEFLSILMSIPFFIHKTRLKENHIFTPFLFKSF